MISQLVHLNWIAALFAFVAYFALGALWFTILFSKPYKISLGRENETLSNNLIFIVGPALCTLVITLASTVFIYALNISTFGGALEFALIIGIGYLVANTINIAINPNIPRPILYGLISGSYHLVGISIVSIIVVWLK